MLLVVVGCVGGVRHQHQPQAAKNSITAPHFLLEGCVFEDEENSLVAGLAGGERDSVRGACLCWWDISLCMQLVTFLCCVCQAGFFSPLLRAPESFFRTYSCLSATNRRQRCPQSGSEAGGWSWGGCLWCCVHVHVLPAHHTPTGL